MDHPLGSIPEGLGMALAQNFYAMQYFSGMAEPERQVFVARARQARSQDEMQQLVNELIRH